MERYRYNLSAELLSYIKIHFINRLDNDKFDNSWNEWITMERVKVLFKIEKLQSKVSYTSKYPQCTLL